MSQTDGRTPVFKGRKFDELTDEEKFIKYGTNCLSDGVQEGIRLIEQGGSVRKALELAATSTEKQMVDRELPSGVRAKAKIIAAKLMDGEELTQEEEVFLVKHEEEIDRELE